MSRDEHIGPLVEMEDFLSWVLHEDDDLLVLNKPGWLVCHPSKNGPMSSLVGVAKEYLRVDSIHLASRLDRETSGVVLLAKHRKAASHWQKGIEQKRVKRRYLAILRGEMRGRKTVSNYLGNDPDSPVFVKQKVLREKTKKAKKAETSFEPLHVSQGHTFCRVLTLTGRKHQIRVHAQWIGHELVGEKLYGPDERIYLEFGEGGWRREWAPLLGMKRQALHGERLGFEQEGEPGFSAVLADDMVDYLHRHLNLGRAEALQISQGEPLGSDNLVV